MQADLQTTIRVFISSIAPSPATTTSQGLAGGLSLALWNRDVRQFLINNAIYFLHEFHIDGFRYDEIERPLSAGARHAKHATRSGTE
jgi:hypothetical protein